MAWLNTPPAAGRAWVPGCRARTFHQSVAPFYDETPPRGSAGRDQFVILISGRVYIPLTYRVAFACSGVVRNPHERLPPMSHICCNSDARVLKRRPMAVRSRV